MRVAVCCPESREALWICSRIEERAAEKHRSVEMVQFSTEEALWRTFSSGQFRGAVVGYGDVRGFLCARRLREEDSRCRVILLDDTDRYAIRGLRIHLTDYLVRPLKEGRLRTAVDHLLVE